MAGTALRIHGLDSGLWYDEIVTLVESVRLPLATIVTHYPSNNDHPFYSVLARLATVAFGEQAWSVRLPAVVFGVAALPALYVLGAGVTSRFEALAAVTLLAVSYHHVWFSQNARGYTILLFCAVLTTHLLLRGLRDARRSAYIGYAVLSAVGAYTHLTMVLVVLGQAMVVAGHILARRGRRLTLRDVLDPALGVGLAGLLTLLLYLPFLVEVKAFFGRKSVGAPVATAGWAVWETVRGLQLGYTMGGAIVLGGLLFLAGCWSYLRQSPTVLALFLLPGGVLFGVAVLLKRPTFPRFFFFLAGFALLIVVRGAVTVAEALGRRLSGRLLGEYPRSVVPAAFVAGAIVVSVLALPAGYRHPKQDYERALRFVEASAGARDAVVVAGGGTAYPYQKYYARPWKRLASADELVAARRQHENVWLLYTFTRYIEMLEPELMSAIVAHCPTVKTFPGTIAGGGIVVSKCGAA